MSLGREELVTEGFQGFVTFKELREGRMQEMPDAPGIYVVLREIDEEPRFLDQNPGGRFKGKDPTVEVAVLKAKWVHGAVVAYIGKADRLRRRLSQFAHFGAGKPIGHWGGRYIWQVEGSGDLVVGWRKTPGTLPRDAELELLQRFRGTYGGRAPFANIAG